MRKLLSKRPEKDALVVAKVATFLIADQIQFPVHARQQMHIRDITRSDVLEVLSRGWREPRKDEWKEAFRQWRYAYRGHDDSGIKNLRVAVALEDSGVIVVTAIDLDKD
jgi:predicted transcriptional regulator